MYEYAPRNEKRRERQIALCLGIVGMASFVASFLDKTLLFFLFRILSYVLLVTTAVIVGRYLSRRYSYRVAPREGGDILGNDLTITEYVNKRTRVVCRISVEDITKVERVTGKNCKAVFKDARGNRIYRYTDCMGYENTYLLWTVDGEETVCVLILADERLLSYLG